MSSSPLRSSWVLVRATSERGAHVSLVQPRLFARKRLGRAASFSKGRAPCAVAAATATREPFECRGAVVREGSGGGACGSGLGSRRGGHGVLVAASEQAAGEGAQLAKRVRRAPKVARLAHAQARAQDQASDRNDRNDHHVGFPRVFACSRVGESGKQ